ncbi:MAG: NAD(P)H-hydrate dehydratase [bacterium]|nr:NAD(P)H-hydrate dehydratase [bacterium]
MKLVTAERMRELDRAAIRERGIPGLDLMERAGAAVARRAAEIIWEAGLRPRALLFAGRGNNGGDAFVAARLLEAEGVRTRTVLLAEAGAIAGDARANLDRLEAAGADIVRADAAGEGAEAAAGFDLVVDGILGTGVAGEVTGPPAEAIRRIRSLRRHVVAIDVPSGIDATSGRVRGVAVRATATVTMGLPKTGLVEGEGPEHCGRVFVADIGLPEDLVRDAPGSGDLIVEADLLPLFPPRRRRSHKGDWGHLLVVAGSPGLTGAACLAALGALRSGAGLVTVAVPRGLNAVIESKLTEAMSMPLPETEGGTLGAAAGREILARADRFDVVAIGPGLSRHPETAAMVRALVEGLERPMVIDADGLTALADDPGILGRARAPIILTPHPGEMGRLLGCAAADVILDRFVAASSFARAHNVTLVLKEALTVIASPDGRVSINTRGNAGMATGGSGDVLTGVIASFRGQGMAPLDAARAGVFVHGDAGDRAALRLGERSLLPSDIIDRLPAAIVALSGRP